MCNNSDLLLICSYCGTLQSQPECIWECAQCGGNLPLLPGMTIWHPAGMIEAPIPDASFFMFEHSFYMPTLKA